MVFVTIVVVLIGCILVSLLPSRIIVSLLLCSMPSSILFLVRILLRHFISGFLDKESILIFLSRVLHLNFFSFLIPVLVWFAALLCLFQWFANIGRITWLSFLLQLLLSTHFIRLFGCLPLSFGWGNGGIALKPITVHVLMLLFRLGMVCTSRFCVLGSNRMPCVSCARASPHIHKTYDLRR